MISTQEIRKPRTSIRKSARLKVEVCKTLFTIHFSSVRKVDQDLIITGPVTLRIECKVLVPLSELGDSRKLASVGTSALSKSSDCGDFEASSGNAMTILEVN